MSKIILKKNGTDYLFGLIPLHYPADRVYLDGDTDKNVQDALDNVEDALDEIQMSNILSAVYPVGSIYMSINNVNPGTLFGGTWVAWGSGKVPVGVDTNDTDFDTVEETGGAKSHKYTPQGSNGNVGATTLTAAQSGVPAHAHGLNSHTHSVGAHKHGLNSHTHSIPALSGAMKTSATVNVEIGTGSTSTTGFGSIDPSVVYTKGVSQGNVKVGWTNAAAISTNASTSGGASGNTANSTAFDTGAASGNTANNTAANASQSHTHSGSTFTGVESTQSHLQPYITCYMWKRTA